MTTLAVDQPRSFEAGPDPVYNDMPVIASDIIYSGAAVGNAGTGSGLDGYARPLVGGDEFEGFAEGKADNSSGAAGAVKVKLKQRGVVKLSVTGVTGATDKNSTVYATDDNTFTLTASGASAIGKVVRYISGTTVMVAFEAVGLRSI